MDFSKAPRSVTPYFPGKHGAPEDEDAPDGADFSLTKPTIGPFVAESDVTIAARPDAVATRIHPELERAENAKVVAQISGAHDRNTPTGYTCVLARKVL